MAGSLVFVGGRAVLGSGGSGQTTGSALAGNHNREPANLTFKSTPLQSPLFSTAAAGLDIEQAPAPPAAEIEATPSPTATVPPAATATAIATVAPPAPVPPTATAIVAPPVAPPPPAAQAPAATSTRVPPPPPPAAPVALTGLEQSMFSSHNGERARGGLAPLLIDSALVQVARQRASDMATKGYFSHNSPSGETAFTILARAGYRYASAGENIARNNYPEGQSVSVAMTGFMNSSTHRYNIMDSGFTSVGIGSVAGRDGMTYYAVVFAGQ